MPRSHSMFALTAVLALLVTPGIAAAQQAPSKASAKTERSSVDETWDETKAMTRKQWEAAKKKWAVEKVKWRACNRQADVQKLQAPKSWSFVASCMTKT